MSVLVICACDPLTDLNEDIKNPAEVPASSLFTNATVSLMDFMTETNVNVNNFRLWSQQWAQTTYPDESNYQLVERNVNGRTWNTLYATVIKDLKDAKSVLPNDPFLPEANKQVQAAIMETLEIFAFHLLVDIFGDIPYTEALDIDNITPKYDDDEAIYNDLITRLDAAIGNLSGESSLGNADLIYGGDAASWRTFANSLKLRMAIRLADKDNSRAKSMVEAAVNDGVFTSSSEDFLIVYESSTPNTNPLWEQFVQSGRSDFVGSNTLVDVMNGLEDPRRPVYFRENITATDSITGDDYTAYVGGIYGDANSYPANSHPGLTLHNPVLPGVVLSYTEVCFLLADAAERGYSVGESAETFYNRGIISSFDEWRNAAAASGKVPAESLWDKDQGPLDYLSKPEVAYSTAPGTWKEKIAMQKWLALYNQGFEAWSTYRIYDAPTMNVAVDAGTVPPSRFTYPVTEYSLNGASIEAALPASGDDMFGKVFWDMD